ncbi:MAG: DUF4037 domain-containing protein [Rectinemataceae bacterium]
MKYKVETVCAFLTDAVSAWKNVECIAIDQRSDVHADDPYFALVIDVYHRGAIPHADRRRKAFGDPGAFETATGRSKDRFFLSSIPVRIEYKSVRRMDAMLDHPMDHIKLLKNSGTYPLYRLMTSRILFGSSGWILHVREKLGSFPEGAWEALRYSFSSKMEHYLEDMGAALVSGDPYFRLVSEAGFIHYTAATLFMANRRFEPSHREIDAVLRALPKLPDDFLGPWETFLRDDTDSTPSRRRELAELMARSVLSLG